MGKRRFSKSLGLFSLLKSGVEDIMGKKFEKWGHFSQVVWKRYKVGGVCDGYVSNYEGSRDGADEGIEVHSM